jgi:hypothetical protein
MARAGGRRGVDLACTGCIGDRDGGVAAARSAAGRVTHAPGASVTAIGAWRARGCSVALLAQAAASERRPDPTGSHPPRHSLHAYLRRQRGARGRRGGRRQRADGKEGGAAAAAVERATA